MELYQLISLVLVQSVWYSEAECSSITSVYVVFFSIKIFEPHFELEVSSLELDKLHFINSGSVVKGSCSFAG